MALTSPNRFIRRVAAIGATALVASLVMAGAGAAVAAPPTPAAASGTPHQGKGYAVAGGDFVGFYLTTTGRRLYCLSPREGLPSAIRLTKTAHYPGVGKKTSAELAYALGRWGGTRTDRGAAAESQVLNTLVGNKADVARRARALPKAVAGLVHAHLRAVHRFHGPYVTRVRTPKAILPGQTATGEVSVTSTATGRRLPHIPIFLGGTRNVAVPHHVRTDGKGVAHFTYRVTDTGEVHVVARAKDLPALSMYQNHPASGRQHMISPVHTVASQGSSSFRASPSGFRHHYACTTACNGRPTTVVRACNPKNHRKSRLVIHYGGRTAVIHFPTSGVRICLRKQIVTRDGEHVWARWQFRTRHGWSKPVVSHGSFTVDCPAVPPVGVTLAANCTRATLTIGLADLGKHGTWTPLVNPSRHRMVLVIGGATQLRRYAGHGGTAVFTAHVSCKTPRTYTWRAGVRRANGRYNYGPQGSITTPGPAAVTRR